MKIKFEQLLNVGKLRSQIKLNFHHFDDLQLDVNFAGKEKKEQLLVQLCNPVSKESYLVSFLAFRKQSLYTLYLLPPSHSFISSVYHLFLHVFITKIWNLKSQSHQYEFFFSFLH